jgi:hypothetical protein
MILAVGPSWMLVRWKREYFSDRSNSPGLADSQPLCTNTVAFVWQGQPEHGASSSRTLT